MRGISRFIFQDNFEPRDNAVDLLGALNASRHSIENEILLLGHYISAVPVAFTQSMRYILSQLYRPMLDIYIYCEKRRLIDFALFELIEKTLIIFIQKTCACMCHTKDDYVLLSRYILNTTSNSIEISNKRKIERNTNEAVSIDDATKFILNLMGKNNQSVGNQYFMKTNSLNGYIYIELLSSSSDIHEDIMHKMKAKNTMLWEVAGDNVISSYDASSSLKYGDDVTTRMSTEVPMNIEVRQKIDALSLDIKQLEAKQTFTATIMMMISNPDTCEDTIRQRQNNILVEIMKHNATLLLSCIVTLFSKLVAILCPETLVRKF